MILDRSRDPFDSARSISNHSTARQQPVDVVELRGVMDAPFDQRIQDGSQAFTKRGEQVFDALAIHGAGLSAHHSMFLKRSQLLDQHLLGDAGDAVFQITGALRAVQQHMKDHRFPASGKDT